MYRAYPFLLAAMVFFGTHVSAKDVEIRVDGGKSRQVYEGFGATTLSLVHPGRLGDTLGPKLRLRVLDALYGQVKLTMGNLSTSLLESTGGWEHRRNDNDDPKVINWNGFDTFQADATWNHVVKPSAALGLDNYSLEGKINWKWVSPWLREIYRRDRQRCLDECAEQVEASVAYWQKIAGSIPRYVHLFNEPTSGNCEVDGADAEMVRDIVKRAGDRLRTAGFKDVKFVVPNEETVERSTAVAKVILEDADARKYVAAVGYHVYPYGSPYASVPSILRDSGSGKPDPASVEQRRRLRDLCRHYCLPVWMTEVSHAEVDPRSFDHLRGRAIHIHDEMVYADASAFYGMNAMWDKKTHAEHFAGRGGEKPNAYLTEEDTIVLADNDANAVLITGMGYAIGHYSRWLNRGAVRLEGSSDDSLVLVTAFKDSKARHVVLVIVNNAPEARNTSVAFSGLQVTGSASGEQSYGDTRWETIEPFAVESAHRIKAAMRAMSVTTLSVALAENDGTGQPLPAHGHSGQARAAVRTVLAPENAFVPDVVVDAKGVLHMVYALNRTAQYVRSTDNGATWTEPVQVNSGGTVEYKMGERGPKLAVGSDGVVHVVWVDCWAPGVRTYVRYARSTDGGKTFEPLKTLSSTNGVDGVTMTADGKGHVMAFWHVAHPRQDEIPQATWLHVARSADNGVSFRHDERVQVGNHSGLACSMCMMRARMSVDGHVYLAFRSAEKNIRDFYVFKGASGENQFTAMRVNEDNWLLKECPMCGPELTVGPDGRLLCAFMSRHNVYWSMSDRHGGFQGHVATPDHERDEIYPTAIANRQGDVLLVWQVGPMSIAGTATVHWACYGSSGSFTGRQGILGRTTSGTKATAFAGNDDCFYIITTARSSGGL
jgi:O-glycosyl hydrolase